VVEAADQIQQGLFAAAGRPDEGDESTRLDGEIHTPDRGHVDLAHPLAFLQPFGPDQTHDVHSFKGGGLLRPPR